MAQFCEGCPVAGDCLGEIVEIEFDSFENCRFVMSSFPHWENRLTHVAQCIDDEGGESEMMQEVDAITLEERVEVCTEPKEVIEPRSFRRKPKIVKICRALGIKPNLTTWDKDRYEQHLNSPDDGTIFDG